MAGRKNFTGNLKKINPNAVLAGNYKKTESPKNDIHSTVKHKSEPQESQHNKKTGKKGQKYLRLDITDYQDYISLMAAHEKAASGKYVSMTQYILRLIEADKQKNIVLFEKLERIEKMKQELI